MRTYHLFKYIHIRYKGEVLLRHQTCLSPPVIFFTDRTKVVLLFLDPLYCLCFMSDMLSCLFLAALWSPGKGLTSWLSCMWCFLMFLSLSHMLFCLFLAALWSPGGKGLTSWLSFMWCFLMFLSLYHMVSWVRCGIWWYWFLIFVMVSKKKNPLFVWGWDRKKSSHGITHDSKQWSSCHIFILPSQLQNTDFSQFKHKS